MAYDPYVDIPTDLRPTFPDAVVLTELAWQIQECVKLRHDFHTAIHIEDIHQGMRQAFIPAVLNPVSIAPERHLNAPPAWESSFASITPEDRRTVAAFANRHRQEALEIKSRATRVTGNLKLGKLVKDGIDAFIPEIGFSAESARYLRRLRKDDRSILDAFQPFGVNEAAVLVKLLIKRTPATYFYW